MMAEGMDPSLMLRVGCDLGVGSDLGVVCDVGARPEVSLLECECDIQCGKMLVCTRDFLDAAGYVA